MTDEIKGTPNGKRYTKQGKSAINVIPPQDYVLVLLSDNTNAR